MNNIWLRRCLVHMFECNNTRCVVVQIYGFVDERDKDQGKRNQRRSIE